AKQTTEWLDDSGIEVLDWPSQSPDLNPIEHLLEGNNAGLAMRHLWFVVKQKLKMYPLAPKNNDQLWNRVVEIWNGLTTEECTNLVASMPKRITAVIAAKGGHTKY
ncbi:hypothetical protein GQ54DRAFT_243869, partial [Martensiomyces pterosporus]